MFRLITKARLQILLGVFILGSTHGTLTAQGRKFTVPDSIGIQRFTDPYPDLSRKVTDFSPDGKSFVVVTTRGLLDKNLLQSTIWLFDVDAEKTYLKDTIHVSPPKPEILITREGDNDSQQQQLQTAILSPQWSANGKSLLFLGRNQDTIWHLYRLNLETKRLEQLSEKEQNVICFEVRGSIVAYAVSIEWPATPPPRLLVGTGESMLNILFPDKHPSYPNQNELWVILHKQAHPVVDPVSHQRLRFNTHYGDTILSLDPNGRRAIVASAVTFIPESWTEYEPGYITGRIGQWSPERLKEAYSTDVPERLLLVDLKTGENSFILDAPRGISLGWLGASEITWSTGGSEVLLSNVFLPLDGISPQEKASREQQPAVIRFEVPDHAWTRVSGYKHPSFNEAKKWRVESVSWGASTDEVVVKYTSPGPPAESFRYVDHNWTSTPWSQTGTEANSAKVLPLIVTLRESMKMPPKVFASATTDGEAKPIWDPNPQFDQIAFADAEIYNWKDEQGREIKGVLIKPPDFDSHKRYPLVIEPRAYTQDEFIVDGTYPTAAAAQAMAADGLMVLQAGEPAFPQTETFRKGTPAALAGYKAAISKLAEEGLIDTKRVGIFGFSRTCDNVMYAITQEPDLFAAATIANGFTYGPMGYFTVVDETLNNGSLKQWALHYGGNPLGDGEPAYLKENAIFNLQNVKAPLRVETHDPWIMFSDWESYAGLRSLEKPVDLIVMPYATHVVTMPADLMESQQGDVDWFRFWLQGYEDSDPAKRSQYARWEHLRELRDTSTKFLK